MQRALPLCTPYMNENMKHIIIFLLFLFSLNSLLSQQDNKFVFGVEGQLLEVKPSIRKNIVGVPVSEGSYSLRANVGYYFPNKRITLLSGVGYKSTNHLIREGNLELIYSEQDAIPNTDGSLTIVYKYPFYTAFGNVDVDIALLANSDQRNFEEGDNMMMNFFIKKNIRWLYVPLSIQYDLIDRKKVDVFLKAGSFFNFIQKNSIVQRKVSIENIYIRSGATDVFESVPYAEIVEPLTKFIPELFLGGGVKIQIAPRLFILGSMEFSTTIKPLYEDEILSTSLNSLGISVGIIYRL